MKSSVVVLAWLLFEIYELYGMEHVIEHSWSWSIAWSWSILLSKPPRLTTQRERESQDQDECIYDQERSGALPRTNNAKIKRELQQNEFRFYE